MVIVTVSNCQLKQDWCGGGGVARRRVCAVQVAALQHCSTAALQQARPGRGSAAWNSIIAQSGHWTLDTTHTTPPATQFVSQNQITEIFRISSWSCAVPCWPCSCRAPVINTGVERSLIGPHHDNSGPTAGHGATSHGAHPHVFTSNMNDTWTGTLFTQHSR